MALSTWPVAALVALMAGALYVRYANPAVGGGNSGEFQVMAPLLGIAHPPSYPLYLLLAKSASLLPLGGDVAWRINVLTALLAAFAVYGAGLLAGALAPRDRVQGSKFRVQSREGGGTHPDSGRGAAALAAALTAAAVAAMPRLWTLAVEAEVFSLHLLLVVVFWLCLVKWLTTRQDRWLLVAGLCAGLGLANHRTFVFMAAGGVLTVLVSRPATLLRLRLVAACAALCLVGLSPYFYVVRGLVVPVPYFSPTDVHRLSKGETWYVLEGNASGETGGGRIVLDLFRNQAALRTRSVWLWRNVSGQFGIWGSAVTTIGAAGLALLLWRRPAWTSGALLGSLGAAVFGMAYGKYPDGDRYLLPLETLVALGAGLLIALTFCQLSRALSHRPAVARTAGAAAGLALGAYWAIGVGVLAGETHATRGGYVYFTLANLDAVEPQAMVCTWWASAWGWWYAQYVDGHRPDVALVPKGPDDCVRDVLPAEFGRRPVYLPALTDKVKASDYVFFPSRDLWLAVARRAPLVDGALLKGPDENIYLYTQGQRRRITSLDAFARRDFSWDRVQLTPDYVLKETPEGPPLE